MLYLFGTVHSLIGWIKPQGCVDEHDTCSSWASEGDCTSNPEWMAIKCPVSCGLCGDTDIEPGDLMRFVDLVMGSIVYKSKLLSI